MGDLYLFALYGKYGMYLKKSILADTCAGTASSKVPVESKIAETGQRC